MSSSQPSNAKFWIWTGLVLLGTAGLLAAAWPATLTLARQQSASLSRAGDSSTGDTARLNYRLANLLDPANSTAAWHYASDLLDSNHPQTALSVLGRADGAGESADFYATRLRVLLETGHADLASPVITQLLASHPSDNQLLLAIMARRVAGQGSEAAALNPLLGSPDALRRAQMAEASNVGLAGQLAASGLLRSSSAMLEALPNTAPRDLLLARIKATGTKKSDWQAAATAYDAYFKLMPADASSRLAYANVLTRLGQTDAAKLQLALASSLTNGRP